MTKPTDPSRPQPSTSPQDPPANPSRRRLLGGMVAAGAAWTLGACGVGTATRTGTSGTSAATDAALDQLLQKHIKHVVVLYAENRSFNNLFADFPGLAQPLSALKPEDWLQRDRDGTVLKTLPPIWGGMVPHAQVVDGVRYHIPERAVTGLPNQPFALRTPDGKALPQAVITASPLHRFYENQLQINGGRNDGFAAWGSDGALVMGHYGDSANHLKLWDLARRYTLCDNFFMGAFGGSFLNHQYLAAAQAPVYPNADKTPARFQIAELEGDDPAGIRPKLANDSPASAMLGRARFASRDALTPDFHAVNTFGPPYAPGFNTDPHDPQLADASSPNTLPPQAHATIGDMLSAKGVEWAWYAGGWKLALEGHGDGAPGDFPQVPNFQPHHQPFNYFTRFAPGTAARRQHLRDAGIGNEATSNHFLAAIEAGTLPPVSFYKPEGDLNLHAGYASVESGDDHLATVIEALEKSPLWPSMLVVMTVDENGGWWDHVAPPKGDRWGPGTRVPALVVSPFAKRGHVDHTIYDTGSILRFITRRFGLRKLPGLTLREEAMVAAGGPPPGDLTSALQFPG